MATQQPHCSAACCTVVLEGIFLMPGFRYTILPWQMTTR
jgi:hypothetical protein